MNTLAGCSELTWTTGGGEPQVTDWSEQSRTPVRASTDLKAGGSSPSERARPQATYDHEPAPTVAKPLTLRCSSMAGAWHARAAWATMRGWLVMTAGPRCSSTKIPWPAAAAMARRRRVLGEDQPDTLTSADNLAMILGRVGEHQAARELAEDTLARRRRVLGEDHPDTLTSAFILAGALFELGEYQAARELNEDILARRRRVLGEDHPDTGASATFAIFLRTPRMLLKTIRWHSRRRHAG